MIWVICKDSFPVCFLGDKVDRARVVEAFEQAIAEELRKPQNERRKVHWHQVREYSPLPAGAIIEELSASPLLDRELGDSLDRLRSLQAQIAAIDRAA
jgi:hypothetical protein